MNVKIGNGKVHALGADGYPVCGISRATFRKTKRIHILPPDSGVQVTCQACLKRKTRWGEDEEIIEQWLDNAYVVLYCISFIPTSMMTPEMSRVWDAQQQTVANLKAMLTAVRQQQRAKE